MFVPLCVSHRASSAHALGFRTCWLQRRHKSFEAWKELGEIPAGEIEWVDGRPYKKRRGGGQALPLPPMLNSVYEEARSKLTKAKDKVDERARTPFQAQLELNAHAMALITPIRRCTITDARLPRHFLQSFECSFENTGEDDRESSPQLQMRVRPASLGSHDIAGAGRYAYVCLDKDVLSCLSSRQHISQLVRSAEEKLEPRLGRRRNKKDKNSARLNDKYLDDIDQLLSSRVQKVVDRIVRYENPLGAGTSRQCAQRVGLMITFGEPLHAYRLPSGVMHYVWDGMPASSEFQQHMAAKGGRTFGLVATNRSTKLAMALDRLFTYRQVPEHNDEPASAAARSAVAQWEKILVD